MGRGFDIFQKFAVKFLAAYGQIIPVKCNQISPPCAHCYQISQGTTKISPSKILQSLFINVAEAPNIHVPVTAAILRFNHI